jgi:hypothetical protein
MYRKYDFVPCTKAINAYPTGKWHVATNVGAWLASDRPRGRPMVAMIESYA